MRRVGTVVAVNGLQTGVRFLTNIALIQALGYNGLALSAALGLLLQLTLLGWLAHRHLAPTSPGPGACAPSRWFWPQGPLS